MPQHEESSIVARLQESIDAVLVPRGFAAGGVGVSEGRRQVIWCAVAEDFAARFPGLPASQEPPEGWSTMCTDVVVDMATADGEWCVTKVSLEGKQLSPLLAGLGLSVAAERAAALIGTPAHACLAPLPQLLLELLDGPGPEH
ncbi:hypothetical protein GTR02_03740 [Kineococcus sp. R8]|uniref:hypothetical protein n=1 Tax=Kineococcus siccus TaxID=2696567 RepID=UPI001411E224|nr:hypothetical protein [Kineococcus siccus]NAZ80926.1 hypothetical protein [Kineococcus siccus]